MNKQVNEIREGWVERTFPIGKLQPVLPNKSDNLYDLRDVVVVLLYQDPDAESNR